MDEGTPTLLEAKTSVILFSSKKASKDACTVLWIGGGTTEILPSVYIGT